MRVAILHEYQEPWDISKFPFDLLYSAAVLRENGIDIMFVDALAEKLSPGDVARLVIGNGIDVVFTAGLTHLLNHRYFEEIKNHKNELKTILGGYDATLRGEDCFRDSSAIDIVIKGDPEFALLDIIRALEKGNSLDSITGVYFKENSGIYGSGVARISNLDLLPFPARDLMPLEKYKRDPQYHGDPAGLMFTSRGCPFRCTFCGHATVTQILGGYRMRSLDNVIDEIQHIVNTYHTHRFGLLDWSFTTSKARVARFCELLIEKGIDITWFCFGHVARVDKELLKLMRKAGCVSINYGIESASQEILDRYKKGSTVEEIKNAFKWTKDAGISATGDFIFGGPYDTPKSIRATLKLAKEVDPDFLCATMYLPIVGSELYKECEEKRLLLDDSIHRKSCGLDISANIKLDPEVERLSLQAIEELHYRIRIRKPLVDEIRHMIFDGHNINFSLVKKIISLIRQDCSFGYKKMLTKS